MTKQPELHLQKQQKLAAAREQVQRKQQTKTQQQQIQVSPQIKLQQNPEMPIEPAESLLRSIAQSASSQQIRCSISNCHYWAEGNFCKAEQVLVTSQTMSKGLNNKMDAPVATQLAMTPISTVAESCCNTFTPAGAYSAFEDGVIKLP